MKRFSLLLGSGIVLLAAVMIVRAALCTSGQLDVTPPSSITFDQDLTVAA